MAETAYTNGQTAFLLSDLIARAKGQHTDLNLGAPGFLQAAQWVLPKYATTYAGNYYVVPSQTSAPTAFPTAQSVQTNGSFYEIAYPADCQDTGILDLEILYGSSNLLLLSQALINANQDESTWDVTSSNTTKVFWRMAGRKVRVYIPASYLSVAPKYALGYVRLPTYPGTVSDLLDVPAEDIEAFYSLWLAKVTVGGYDLGPTGPTGPSGPTGATGPAGLGGVLNTIVTTGFDWTAAHGTNVAMGTVPVGKTWVLVSILSIVKSVSGFSSTGAIGVGFSTSTAEWNTADLQSFVNTSTISVYPSGTKRAIAPAGTTIYLWVNTPATATTLTGDVIITVMEY